MLDYRLKQSKKYMKSHRGKRPSGPMVACILLVLLILIYLLTWLRSGKEAGGEDYIVFLPKQEEGSRLIVQEIVCPKNAELCFKVEDYQVSSGGSQLSTKYYRRIMVETVDKVVQSVAELVPNPGEPFSAENAKGWSILKTRLILPYTKAVIGQMLATGCVQMESSKRVLMVGLGGAGIPNFLDGLEGNHEIVSVELEPAMDYIAHKWFGLEKSARQKVVIQDGVQYFKDWQPSQGTFDCILIDACTGSEPEGGSKYPLICPLADFVNNEEIVKKMFAMLKTRGALLINTFAIEADSNLDEISQERQFLLKLFQHHFGQCYYADAVHNKILVCSLALSRNEPMTNEKYAEAIRKLPKWLQDELDTKIEIISQVWRKQREDF